MKELFYIMITVFVSYVVFIWKKFGVLTSISNSYIQLPRKLKPLFTFFCWGFALPALVIGFNLSEGSHFQFLMFFSGGGILFVGAAPDTVFNKLEKKVHSISAVIGVISLYLFSLLIFPHLWYITIVALLASIVAAFFKNRIWWIEIIAFVLMSIIFKIMLS